MLRHKLLAAFAPLAILASAEGAAAATLTVTKTATCGCCGGRGEVWSETCDPCHGKGQELMLQRLTVNVPAGVSNGDRFSFTLWLPRGPRTRVDVRVAVR